MLGGCSACSLLHEELERLSIISRGAVYNCTSTFLPMMVKAEEGHIVNTISVNGFWASVGPLVPHTSYSAAKFAVKGFSEALIADLRINAPHISVSVVMPGHIGTSIRTNSLKIQARNDSDVLSPAQIAQARAWLTS